MCRAKAHALLGQKQEAEKRYAELMNLGFAEGECLAAIAHLHKIPLDDLRRPKQQVEKYVEIVENLSKEKPSKYLERHLLDCCPLDQFKGRLLAYVLPYIKKMIPSLFSVLKSLYTDKARADLVGEVFNQLREELESGDYTTSFGGEKSPCYVLWVYAYLASHYRRVGDAATAHQYVDKAIAHTPTLEMLYVERAKIFQSEGKTAEAAEAADFARKLDLQDKYLNTVAARFYFRNNDIERGEEVMQLFYKEPTVKGDTFLIALESQCSWYAKEVGEAFYRKGDYVSALQNLLMFDLHHKQNLCELNDFHSYVFRRNTMRAWFDVIHNMDHVEENKFFLSFCPGLVRTYIKVHQVGEEAARAAHTPRPELSLEGLNAEDTKRITGLLDEFYMKDVDLSEPLQKAARYMNSLLQHRAGDVETHRLAVEFYTVREKPLLVARALHTLKRLKYADVDALVKEFQSGLLAKQSSAMDKRVKEVVEELLSR
ncbi:NMDA receptor-regulated protein 1, putative [Angomonas deanei]|uniref:NMDA receptor-regulated protein 1, putative n=1 Tax=Angomonas deanei TaxID=59799 RepID=A0A7G2C3E8_9TRYP|nr:NMDA receptor-regulated protein 1, putative [Angomonas deanei]